MTAAVSLPGVEGRFTFTVTWPEAPAPSVSWLGIGVVGQALPATATSKVSASGVMLVKVSG